MTDGYDDLIRTLNEVSDGELNEDVASRLSKLLTSCWASFDGSSETSMAAHKLDGRAHRFRWKSPILTFEIDRHGGTVNGSTRADRQEWTIDVEKRTARAEKIDFRQLTARAPSFKAEPVVSDFMNVISQRLTTPPGWNLKWISDDEIRVVVRSLLPDPYGFKQTIEGRAKRLRKRLIDEMASNGWQVASRSGPYLVFRREPIATRNSA
jgi:hypothetical protein